MDCLGFLEHVSPGALRCLGKGACGSVWTDPEVSSIFIIKRYTNNPGRSLRNDAQVHQKLDNLQSLSNRSELYPFQVPRFYGFFYAEFGSSISAYFPPGHQEPRETLFSERIPSMAPEVRNNIINRYCPERLRPYISDIKAAPGNQDCIIRPLLGRRRLEKSSKGSQSRLKSWSIRNYQLHLDQMEEMELDVEGYACAMADALAFMHWEAKIDAADVEFVLAPPRKEPGSSKVFSSTALGEHALWILDFDCCKPIITVDEEALDRITHCFYRNDSFFPRPNRSGRRSQLLWGVFKTRYLQSSRGLLGSTTTHVGLPEKLMDKIEEDGRGQEPVEAGQE